ncbi:hypothetical protein GX48_01685 [Paracoccidioides brasiliensis]|nr:hypothetical protein GX48_01685 [Paracoccidioides brasiliensis]
MEKAEATTIDDRPSTVAPKKKGHTFLVLNKIAVQSANREKVAHVRKLAEGGFYRVLLTMDDVVEVIVKIPYSITVPKQLATEE